MKLCGAGGSERINRENDPSFRFAWPGSVRLGTGAPQMLMSNQEK